MNSINIMSMNINEVLKDFKKRVKNLYGDKLKQIILYGSCARGDASKESDIDLLIILRGRIVPGKEIDRMIDIITEINLKHDVLISVYPVSEEDYKKVKSPLLINIRREGIII